jgi:hypothetical protein
MKWNGMKIIGGLFMIVGTAINIIDVLVILGIGINPPVKTSGDSLATEILLAIFGMFYSYIGYKFLKE